MTVEPFPGTYPGTISAAPDVARLALASDLVCRARVERVGEDGDVAYAVRSETLTFGRAVASARVERVYLGSVEPGRSIAVEFLRPHLPAVFATLDEGADAVLFLVDSGDRYRLTDFASGVIRLGDPAAVASLRPVLEAAVSSTDERVANVARAIATDLPAGQDDR